MTMEEEAADAIETGAPAPPVPGATAAVAAAVETVPDFTKREFALREWMDEPCTYADYSAAAQDLAAVNRLTRGYRPTLEFLARVLERTKVGQEPLHVVDVGCGHGDGLREIYRWAAKRSVPLRLTGIDRNPYAARLARECDRNERVAAKTIAWVTGDSFGVELERPPDVVISSLFTHHLDDASLVRFLRWSEEQARVGWLVNDLQRSERTYRIFGWLAKLMQWHPMVAQDGPVSFRRAFSAEDWRRYLGEAGVEGARVFEARPGRLCVERLKAPG